MSKFLMVSSLIIGLPAWVWLMWHSWQLGLAIAVILWSNNLMMMSKSEIQEEVGMGLRKNLLDCCSEYCKRKLEKKKEEVGEVCIRTSISK